MPLTIEEAIAVNTLLEYIQGPRCSPLQPRTAGDARKAASTLAAGAFHTLMWGWHPERVQELWALPSHTAASNLMGSVEGLLAELGATEPGAAVRNGDIEEPAAMLLDHVYDCWNQVMREISDVPDAILEPNPDAAIFALQKAGN